MSKTIATPPTPIELNQRSVFVTGLPRAGSTLLCQLLGHHPELYSTGLSSPLANSLLAMRDQWSRDPFLLSQLDVDFDLSYQRLLNASRGFVNGWFAETDKPIVVDKNRAWLGMIDAAAKIDPEAKFIVCIRELGQLFGSIEAQHQKTVLLDSGDGTASMNPYGRATAYFKDGGMVASCLSSVESALEDLSDDLRSRLYFLKFEDLISNPVGTMNDVWQFIGTSECTINPEELTVKKGETDSHYRFKFLHTTHSSIRQLEPHRLPARTQNGLQGQHEWYYRVFYPHLIEGAS
jgi:sulfotransferase